MGSSNIEFVQGYSVDKRLCHETNRFYTFDLDLIVRDLFGQFQNLVIVQCPTKTCQVAMNEGRCKMPRCIKRSVELYEGGAQSCQVNFS